MTEMTDRMREVLEGIKEGKKNDMIASELGISPKTAEKYRAQLFELFQVDNAVSLVVTALRKKVIKL